MMSIVPSTVYFLSVMLLTMSIAGCDIVELQSQWRENPISIDGIGIDWPEDMSQYLHEKPRVLVSVMNDKDNLYIRLMIRDRTTQMMFIRAGFITWVDEGGGSKKKFGVQFPVPKLVQGVHTMLDHKPRNSMKEILEDSRNHIAILHRPPEDRPVNTISPTDAAVQGVLAGISMDSAYLTYELQVPVPKGKNIIGIGFKTGQLKRPQGQGRQGSGSGAPHLE